MISCKKCMFALTIIIFLLVTIFSGIVSARSIEIFFSIHSPETTNEFKAMERFKKSVEEKTNGNILVKLYPGAVLGAEKANLGMVKTNEIQMTVIGDLLTSQYAPEYDPTVVPFAFPDLDSVLQYLDGPFGEKIEQAVEQKGNVLILGRIKRGSRKLTANKLIKTPSELKGLKIRVPEISSWITVWSSLGTLPTPIAADEIYTSLLTNVVDAQENPYETTYTRKLYEVQHYQIKTNHLFNFYNIVINKDFYNSLTPDYQKIIQNAMDEAIEWANSHVDAREKELEQKLIEYGMELVDVDTKLFSRAAKSGIKEVAKNWAPGVWDEVITYVGE